MGEGDQEIQNRYKTKDETSKKNEKKYKTRFDFFKQPGEVIKLDAINRKDNDLKNDEKEKKLHLEKNQNYLSNDNADKKIEWNYNHDMYNIDRTKANEPFHQTKDEKQVDKCTKNKSVKIRDAIQNKDMEKSENKSDENKKVDLEIMNWSRVKSIDDFLSEKSEKNTSTDYKLNDDPKTNSRGYSDYYDYLINVVEDAAKQLSI